MKIYTKIFLILFVSILGCREDLVTNPVQENSQKKLFQEAYELDSTEKFLAFLNNWNQEFDSITDEELSQKPDSVQEAYNLYEAFYDPLNLNKYGDSTRVPEVGNDYYENTNYFLIQNTLPISIDTELPESIIEDFRPQLNFNDSIKILFFTNFYNELFSNFLDDTKIGYNEIQSRYDFISNFLQISHKYGIGWHFLTHPYVRNISFNSSYTEAIIYFRIRLEGGEAFFEKQNNQWVMINSKLTWIE